MCTRPNVALAIVNIILMGAGRGELFSSCFPLTDPRTSTHRAQHFTLNLGVGRTNVVGVLDPWLVILSRTSV